MRNGLDVNNKDIESTSVEILSDKETNTLFNVLYRPPNSQIEPFEKFVKHVFSKTKNTNKAVHIAGDFNLNLLDHDTCNKKSRFFNFNP